MKSLRKINKVAASIFMVISISTPAWAQREVIKNPSLQRQDNEMTAALTLDLANAEVKSNDIVVFTPMLINGSDTLAMPSIGVYGRTRWIQYERRNGKPYADENPDVAMRHTKDMSAYNYVETFPYQDWMNGSELIVVRNDYGCAGCGKGEEDFNNLASYSYIPPVYEPRFVFQELGDVEGIVKTAELSGRAFIDFKVNQTNILPDYRNNSVELGKILATIDSVKNDRDITVTSIFIKGTASPEGSYQNNVRLAKGRTEALKNYVQKLYHFPEGFIKTEYEPVDWQGLADFLNGILANPTTEMAQTLPHAQEILAIVNGDLEPYQRNQKIKTTYPKEYNWLLQNVYPSLRHSDYKIEYVIRSFTEVAEIEEVLRTNPNKLNLNELYFLASNYETGSQKYNEVIETAAALFPNDEVANLNAGVVAMRRGDLVAAERYLSKAGSGMNAVYSRGVLNALKGNYAEALKYMQQAVFMGFVDNDGIVDTLTEIVKYSK